VIDKKRAGGTVRPPDPVTEDDLKPVPDLMAALKETLKQSGKRGGRKRQGRDRPPKAMNREQLYERAKRSKVKRRSSMSKREPIEALEE